MWAIGSFLLEAKLLREASLPILMDPVHAGVEWQDRPSGGLMPSVPSLWRARVLRFGCLRRFSTLAAFGGVSRRRRHRGVYWESFTTGFLCFMLRWSYADPCLPLPLVMKCPRARKHPKRHSRWTSKRKRKELAFLVALGAPLAFSLALGDD